MRKIVYVDGGIGRVICATGPIARLFDKERCEIVVVTPWTEVFWNNPAVYKLYSPDTEYLWDDVVRHGEYLVLEPYHDHLYYTQKAHLSASMNNKLTGENIPVYPLIYLSPEERRWGMEIVQHIRSQRPGPVVAFQPFGSTFQMDDAGGSDRTNRSLNMMQVGYLLQKIDPSITMVNCSHVELPFQNAWNIKMTLRQLFAIVAACDFIVSVDSCVTHIAAAFNKRGISINGSTYAENIGYKDFLTCYRDGFPKGYEPNRINGWVSVNDGAMEYSTYELYRIAHRITTQNFNIEDALPKEEDGETTQVDQAETSE